MRQCEMVHAWEVFNWWSGWKISSNLYWASVCDMKNSTFLLHYLSKKRFYIPLASWYRLSNNVFGKFPDLPRLLQRGLDLQECHTLTEFSKLCGAIFLIPIAAYKNIFCHLSLYTKNLLQYESITLNFMSHTDIQDVTHWHNFSVNFCKSVGTFFVYCN